MPVYLVSCNINNNSKLQSLFENTIYNCANDTLKNQNKVISLEPSTFLLSSDFNIDYLKNKLEDVIKFKSYGIIIELNDIDIQNDFNQNHKTITIQNSKIKLLNWNTIVPWLMMNLN